MRWLYVLSVVAVLVINTVGLAVIYRRLDKFLQSSPPNALDAVRANTAEIADKLTAMQNQLTRLQSPDSSSSVLGITASPFPNQLSDLLPDIPDSISTRSYSHISISKDVSEPVNVYKEQADFSTIIGQLIPGQKYPFSTKLNNWYQVNLAEGKTGWVKAAQVYEIP